MGVFPCEIRQSEGVMTLVYNLAVQEVVSELFLDLVLFHSTLYSTRGSHCIFARQSHSGLYLGMKTRLRLYPALGDMFTG